MRERERDHKYRKNEKDDTEELFKKVVTSAEPYIQIYLT